MGEEGKVMEGGWGKKGGMMGDKVVWMEYMGVVC